MHLKLRKYIDTCEDCKIGDATNYSYYAHGKFLPWIQNQRDKNKLRIGESIVRIEPFGNFDYYGEIDDKGKACGSGVAIRDKHILRRNDPSSIKNGPF